MTNLLWKATLVYAFTMFCFGIFSLVLCGMTATAEALPMFCGMIASAAMILVLAHDK